MNIALGIDTGGTYTDAVLADYDTGRIISGIKSQTTRHDLSVGIKKAIGGVFADTSHDVSPLDVNLVALSTTLATNSIVEGHGSPICLILVGYDKHFVGKRGFDGEFVTRNAVYVDGGHDTLGNERQPLNEAQIESAVAKYKEEVEAFAVSGFFSVLNPSHELRVVEIVKEMTKKADGTHLPITCGHELTTRLDSVRRATTVALNATLIPLLRELMLNVSRTLKETGIDAPLMVVKGDGSLVGANWALLRPVETILSGPAASVVGAYRLARKGDVWVADMGGTTTDIASLRNGRPQISPEGASVGKFRTMVEAIDVHTVGLGGDSHVAVLQKNSPRTEWMKIGPQRVVPLCHLADWHPQILTELRSQIGNSRENVYAGQFVLANRKAIRTLSEQDRRLLAQLAEGPKSIVRLKQAVDSNDYLLTRQLERLRSERLLLHSGFTPTDALQVLGKMAGSQTEASRMGAKILAKKAGLSMDELCRKTLSRVSDMISTELSSTAFGEEASEPDWSREPTAAKILRLALGKERSNSLKIDFTLQKPIVAVGAPVGAYFPQTSRQLHTDLIIPDHAEVASAVGALSGGIVQRCRVVVSPLNGVQIGYRVHLPDGIRDFENLDEGIAYAHRSMSAYLQERAKRVGADQIEIKMNRKDRNAPIGVDGGANLYLESELLFTATGRPGFASMRTDERERAKT